jgi:hypothetical protein
MVLAPPALATPQAPGAAAPATQDQHCIYDVVTKASKCYAHFADVTRALSAGTVALDSPDQLTDDVVEQMAAAYKAGKPGSAAAAEVVGKVHEHANSGGKSYTFHAPHGCTTSSTQFRIDSMPVVEGFDWNDKVSSFASYASCRTTLYTIENLGGTPYTGTNGNLPANINDTTSSIKYHR